MGLKDIVYWVAIAGLVIAGFRINSCYEGQIAAKEAELTAKDSALSEQTEGVERARDSIDALEDSLEAANDSLTRVGNAYAVLSDSLESLAAVETSVQTAAGDSLTAIFDQIAETAPVTEPLVSTGRAQLDTLQASCRRQRTRLEGALTACRKRGKTLENRIGNLRVRLTAVRSNRDSFASLATQWKNQAKEWKDLHQDDFLERLWGGVGEGLTKIGLCAGSFVVDEKVGVGVCAGIAAEAAIP